MLIDHRYYHLTYLQQIASIKKKLLLQLMLRLSELVDTAVPLSCTAIIPIASQLT